MQLIRLFTDADLTTRKEVLVTALISSVAGVSLLALINSASEIAARHEPIPVRSMFLYMICFGIFYLGNRASLLSAYDLVETALQKLRQRVSRKICRAELLTVDRLGRGELYTTFSEATNNLSQVTPALVAGMQQGLLAIACVIYITTLSTTGFMVVAGVTALAAFFFIRSRKAQQNIHQELAETEASLLDSVSAFVDGFKEIRVSYKKSTALHQSFQETAAVNEKSKLRLAESWTFTTLFTNLYLYVLLAILVFVLPQFVADLDQTIIKLTAACLFIIGPINTVVNILPSVDQAESALTALSLLEERLESIEDSLAEENEDAPLFEQFEKLQFTDAVFHYRADDGEVTFTSGPWSLSAKPGELIFLVGGNGSGKSTVLKLLTGLYPLESGTIELNESELAPDILRPLREMYSGVFSDFHLFDRLYGLEGVEPAEVQTMIERMELKDKVCYEDGRFSTLSLSTGQRKRLALIVALLEDKPVYVFDEWAADQDKHFRDEFYHKILPDLAARKKTVFVVTHDDRYWHLADRVIKLDRGRFVQEGSQS